MCLGPGPSRFGLDGLGRATHVPLDRMLGVAAGPQRLALPQCRPAEFYRVLGLDEAEPHEGYLLVHAGAVDLHFAVRGDDSPRLAIGGSAHIDAHDDSSVVEVGTQAAGYEILRGAKESWAEDAEPTPGCRGSLARLRLCQPEVALRVGTLLTEPLLAESIFLLSGLHAPTSSKKADDGSCP